MPDLAPLNATLITELLALGLVVGFLAGLLGVGGGMMMVPVLTLLFTQRGVPGGLAVKMAIATSMSTIVFTSLSSVRAHQALGNVRWPVVRSIAPGIVAGSLVAGAGAFALLKGQALALVFSAFIGYMALQMLRGGQPRPERELPGSLGLAGVGGAIGFLSALVGAGGAFLSVPFMTWCNVPPRQAVGTSSALGFPIALASTAGYVISGWGLPPPLPGSVGFLYLPALVLVSLASMSLAPLGARAAQRLPVATLKRLFALLMLGLATTMLWRAFSA